MLKLEKWFEINKNNSYATNEELQYLSHETKLTKKQVSYWLANKRKTKNNKKSDTLNVADKILLNEYFNENNYPSNRRIKELSLKRGQPGRTLFK